MEPLVAVADAFLALIDRMHESGLQMVPAQIAGASPGALRVIHYVRTWPGSGVLDIANKTGLAKPTVSLIVKDLVAREVFRREVLEDDGRRVCLYLTAGGELLYLQVKEYRIGKASQLLSVLKGEELGTMVYLMEKILDQWRNA